MASEVSVINQQTIQFDVPGLLASDRPTRVLITTGMAICNLQVPSTTAEEVRQSGSFKFLVDPQIASGQFRKAVATVTPAAFGFSSAGDANYSARWSIDDVSATLDDESGKTEVRFDATVVAGGAGTHTILPAIAFQVTTTVAL